VLGPGEMQPLAVDSCRGERDGRLSRCQG
jgi:hypothetical protein